MTLSPESTSRKGPFSSQSPSMLEQPCRARHTAKASKAKIGSRETATPQHTSSKRKATTIVELVRYLLCCGD